jgi:hypothetical protein
VLPRRHIDRQERFASRARRREQLLHALMRQLPVVAGEIVEKCGER